jgi:phospholipase/carboxylesterase
MNQIVKGRTMSFFQQKKWLVVFVPLILLVSFSPISSLEEDSKQADSTDRSGPDEIDPLKKGIYDFLDTDLNPIEYRAAEAYKAGRFSEAAQCYLHILRFDYADARAMYNLACCYGMMGEGQAAADLLLKAVKAGFMDIDRILNNRAFLKLKANPGFADLLGRLKDYGTNLGETIYFPGTKLFACRVHLPKGYKKTKRYPLVIGLHGHGANAEGMASLRKFLGKLDFIFASPDGPYSYRMQYRSRGKMRSWDFDTQDEELWKVADPLSVEYIKQAARHLSGLYPTDAIYLMGHSQGAAYAYITGIKNPDLFRGIICFGGRIPSLDKPYSQLKPEDLQKGSGLRVFIAHGIDDPALNIQNARQARALLEQHGYKPEYFEFEGGHEVSPEAIKKVAAWLSEEPESMPGK